jgi:hypothetical protein
LQIVHRAGEELLVGQNREARRSPDFVRLRQARRDQVEVELALRRRPAFDLGDDGKRRRLDEGPPESTGRLFRERFLDQRVERPRVVGCDGTMPREDAVEVGRQLRVPCR